jgi:uncharacterized protein YlxW (UPF0749 family)
MSAHSELEGGLSPKDDGPGRAGSRRNPSRRRPRPRSSSGAVAVWLIALLVALVATVQLRSQAEVERSLQQADPATLAFSIDQLHRSNDSLEAEITSLKQRQSTLQAGGGTVADQELKSEADQLRMLEGLVPVHGPGIVMTLDASGLTALDMQDALNNLAAGGGEAMAVNGHRVVVGVDIEQSESGVTIDGSLVPPPWIFTVIGDSTRLAETADLMTQQLRGDRRVHQATYSVEPDVVLRAVITERPFVYGS